MVVEVLHLMQEDIVEVGVALKEEVVVVVVVEVLHLMQEDMMVVVVELHRMVEVGVVGP